MKLRTDSNRRRFKWIFATIKSNHNSNLTLLKLLDRFNSICLTINSHNDYWKYFLFSFLSFHIVLDVLLFYVPNFAKENFIFKLYFYFILLTSLSTLLFVFKLAVSVSDSVCKYHEIFINEIKNKKITITFRIKVTN